VSSLIEDLSSSGYVKWLFDNVVDSGTGNVVDSGVTTSLIVVSVTSSISLEYMVYTRDRDSNAVSTTTINALFC
jgi:hypothetical protein